jgi:hypothetical protein
MKVSIEDERITEWDTWWKKMVEGKN